MADVKVSGLTAAGSFLDTHEFPVNEAGTSKKVTGTQIRAKVAQGTMGYVQVTANQAGWTTVVDITSLTLTVTPVAGRRLRITLYIASVQSSVGTDVIILGINEGVTQLSQANAIGSNTMCVATAVVTPTAAAHTYKGTIQRVGTGTGTINAGTTFPAYLLIEDIGT